MSWVRIWVHLVFSTKHQQHFLNTLDLRKNVFEHIAENAKEKEIWLDCVNGFTQHVHCLISLGKDQTMSKVAQLIKGESSYWINKNNLTASKFAWQDDYWAVSVSNSHVDKVRKYIQDQEDHHRIKTFDEEIGVFMKKFGFEVIKGADDCENKPN
jgi:putative transposase